MKKLIFGTNSMFRISVVVLIVIFNFACEHEENTFQPMLNIHGVLRSDCGGQRVLLNRTYSMDEPEQFDLGNALIVLTGGGLSDTMLYFSEDYFDGYPYLLAPRTTYQIMAYAEGYDTLYGQTTMPGDFEIIWPVPGSTVGFDDTLVFTASEGAREYQIACIDAYNATDYFWWVIWPSAEPESLFKFPLSIFSIQFGMGYYKLMVLACDSNFFDYEYYYKDDPPQCGVKGGIGLFGSMWVKKVDVYLKVN
jgi:hypothetical protein